ncbi:MAG: porin family protein [Acidobacteria bacterium]|nr:porin family protein [Acidobacteriota bacterium]
MRRVGILLISAAMASAPVLAQDVDLAVWGVSHTFQGDNRIDDVNDIDIEFDENIGFGLTGDLHWTDLFSTEIGVYALDADGTLNLGFLDERIDLGSLDVMPVTATLRAHFGTDRFDVYVGAGGAWVMFDDLSSVDLREGGTEFIEIDDELTWLANAGLTFWLNEGFGIGVDAKWIALEADTLSDTGEAIPLELDPLMISGGLILRF